MNSAQDTNFIDMKYIILYRKLGYKEIKPDIFEKKYNFESIVIESEKQYYTFSNKKYNLITYRDMVVLELLDRLLMLGYKSKDLTIWENEIILRRNHVFFLSIKCFDWGDDYLKSCNNDLIQNDFICYCSRLTGGLIEYKYYVNKDGFEYDYGLFEEGLYPAILSKRYSGQITQDSDFLIEDSTLVKYLGFSEIVEIPSYVTCIGVGAFWNNTHIRKVVIPEGVTTIKGDAFVYCYNLENINIPSKVNQIGDNPFAGFSKLKLTFNSKHFIY